MVAGGQGHLLLEETIREDDYKNVIRFFPYLFYLCIYLDIFSLKRVFKEEYRTCCNF